MQYSNSELEQIIQNCKSESQFNEVSESIAFLIKEGDIKKSWKLRMIMIFKFNELTK